MGHASHLYGTCIPSVWDIHPICMAHASHLSLSLVLSRFLPPFPVSLAVSLCLSVSLCFSFSRLSVSLSLCLSVSLSLFSRCLSLSFIPRTHTTPHPPRSQHLQLPIRDGHPCLVWLLHGYALRLGCVRSRRGTKGSAWYTCLGGLLACAPYPVLSS